MTGTWRVKLADAEHLVTAELSPMTGRLKVSLDGVLVDVSTVLWILGEIRSFGSQGHTFVLSVKGPGYFGGHLALSLDGVEIPAGVTAAAQQQAPPTSLQFVKEQNVIQTEEIVSVDDYPLDNTYGSKPLVSERQVSRETEAELTVSTTNEITGKINLDLAALHAEMSDQLSKTTGVRANQKVTESETLTFTAGPNESVTYQVVWKRKMRTGEQIFQTSGGPLIVP